MKRYAILTGLCLLLASSSYPQSIREKWIGQTDRNIWGFPQRFLSDSEDLFQEASKMRDAPNIVLSFILKANCRYFIDKASLPASITEIEHYISGNKSILENALLHAFVARLYNHYYANNRNINQRTPVTGEIPEDIDEWSANLFQEKITSHCLAAIEQAAILKKTNMQDFKVLLHLYYPYELLPTLFDFLVYEGVDIMTNLEHYLPRIPETKHENCLQPLNQFLTNSISPHLSVNATTLYLFQQLLVFQKIEKNEASLVIIDLARLAYERELVKTPESDSLYLLRLHELKEKYNHIPSLVDILYTEAQFHLDRLQNRPYPNGSYPPDNYRLLRAHLLAKEGQQVFPAYSHQPHLLALQKSLEEPVFRLYLEKEIHPGMLPLKIEYTNVEEMDIVISKIDTTSTAYREKNIPKTKTITYHHRFQLPRKVTKQDSVLYIPIETIGLYEIKAGIPKGHTDSTSFVCTSLHTTFRERDSILEFLVRDVSLGTPVKGASVRLYSHFYPKNSSNFIHEEIATITTNQEGIASFPYPKVDESSRFQLFYETTSSQNPNGEIKHMYLYNQRRGEATPMVEFYTDRGIYRPGQTVFYKGIAYKNGNERKTDSRYSTTLSLYSANNQELLSQDVKANEWGAFSGHFVLPQETINGWFHIRTPNYTGISFRVEEYKLPGFEIIPDILKTEYQLGDSIFLKGSVKTLSGIRLPDTKIRYELSRHGYVRGRYTPEEIEKGEVITDQEGRYQFVFRSEEPDIMDSQFGFHYSFKLTATDSKGETRSTTQQISIGKEPYSVWVILPTRINKHNPLTCYIKAINPAGYDLPKTFSYRISRLAPLRSIEDHYHVDSLHPAELLLEGKLHSSDSLQMDIRKWSSGAYLVEASGTDIKQGAPSNKRIVYLYSPSDKKPPFLTYEWVVVENNAWRHDDEFRSYWGPGKEAMVYIGTSAKKRSMMVELFAQGKLVKREVIPLSNKTISYKIPYLQAYGMGAELIVSSLKNNRLFEQRIHLQVEQESLALVLKEKRFRDHLTPGMEENWTFSVENQKGEAVQAEVMAVMYDRSLDLIHPHGWYTRHLTSFYRDYNAPWTKNTSTQLTLTSRTPYYYGKNLYRPSYFLLFNFNPHTWTSSITSHSFSGSPISKRSSISLSEIGAKPAPEVPQAPPLRKNFNETAFFYPHLYSNATGEFKISFTVPDAITGWKLMLLAHTPQLQVGYLEKRIISVKELTIKPNLPRFFRAGDHTVIKATISNQSKETAKGEAAFELFDPLTDSVILRRTAPFSTQAGENQTVAFALDVPENIHLVGCRITAVTPTFSDGEQHLIPVAPDEIPITEALPIYSAKKGTSQHVLKPGASQRKDFRLTLEMTANPIWYAIMALPSLQDGESAKDIISLAAALYGNSVGRKIAQHNPAIAQQIQHWKKEQGSQQTLHSRLEQNSELKSVALELSPWLREARNETERMQVLEQLFDQNRAAYLQQRLVTKISELQNENGSWSWFKGMPGDVFTTCNTLITLAHTRALHETLDPITVKLQTNAIQFLDNEAIRIKKEKTWPSIIHLYTRSLYQEIPWGEAKEAYEHFLNGLKANWLQASYYEKALTATTLFRYGYKEEAQRIVNSLRQHATLSGNLGMYWANNRSSNFYINSAILTHTAIMEAFLTVDPCQEEIDRMNEWLLRQKQTQHWGEVPSTVMAIQMLTTQGSPTLDRQEEVTLSLGNREISTTPSGQALGYIKESFSSEAITPDMLQVNLTKKENTPSWGALYLQYFAPINQVQKTGSNIQVGKALYREETTPTGKQLVPLHGEAAIGDKVVVRLTVKTDRDMQYVHLKDLRAACFEPVNQLSGTRWREEVVYYLENKDASTNFFFHYLPKGTYVFEYPLWVNQSGNYQDGIASIQCLYSPEFTAHSDAREIRVK